MYAVGIDVSKGKSAVAILNGEGKILEKPFEIQHNEIGINSIFEKIKEYPKNEVRFLIEATSHYHYPVLLQLINKKYYVCVENALVVKKYCDTDLRKVKNDKKDAIKLAEYCIEKWHKLKQFKVQDGIRNELTFLSREYSKFLTTQIRLKTQLNDLLDKTFPTLKDIVNAEVRYNLFLDIYEKYWNPEIVLSKNKEDFIDDIENISKKRGHRIGKMIGTNIYESAPIIITSCPCNEITQLAIANCIQLLRQTIEVVDSIISKMNELSSKLEEFKTVKEMKGVGPKTLSRLIAEIGDVRRFKNANSLIAYCGIDTPPYQSGSFNASERHITKRGNKNLRKVGYEIMRNLKTSKPKEDNAVYKYILKKELEGKNKCVAKIAGLNKFLRIYYARVMELYK